MKKALFDSEIVLFINIFLSYPTLPLSRLLIAEAMYTSKSRCLEKFKIKSFISLGKKKKKQLKKGKTQAGKLL